MKAVRVLTGEELVAVRKVLEEHVGMPVQRIYGVEVEPGDVTNSIWYTEPEERIEPYGVIPTTIIRYHEGEGTGWEAVFYHDGEQYHPWYDEEIHGGSGPAYNGTEDGCEAWVNDLPNEEDLSDLWL